ncbi:superinfection immunity protein [Flavobacterium aquidurense]|uniref:superinfection immunity protein n=1 Tax=Flavobacterium aquidurense TaxID=362413 RepID=UPI00286443EF|nr:hypothetical protein [Flavobacterium aquidurense]
MKIKKVRFRDLLLFPFYAYFFPSYLCRNHQNPIPISVLNLFLGWTIIGWICALIWALNFNNKNYLYNHNQIDFKAADENYRRSQEMNRIYDKQ